MKPTKAFQPRRVLALLFVVAFAFFSIASSYALNAQASNNQLQVWEQSPAYPFDVLEQSCVISSSYVYCIGGINSTNSGFSDSSAVYYSQIQGNKSLGTWNKAPSYPYGVAYQSCATNSTYVYCIAGVNAGSGGSETNVYYAAIQDNGNLSSWKASASYPAKVYAPSCIIASGYVYCMGGAPTNATWVYYSQIQSNGDLSSWKQAPSYPFEVYSQSCTADSGYLYCIGGADQAGGFANSNSTYFAQIETNGDLGPWQASPRYPAQVVSESCVASAGYVLCVGGNNPEVGDLSSVYYDQVQNSGNLSSWHSDPVYPFEIYGQSCVTSSGYVYCIGGGITTPASYYVNYVYYADLLPSSTSSSVNHATNSTSDATSGNSIPFTDFAVAATGLVATIVGVSVVSYFVKRKP